MTLKIQWFLENRVIYVEALGDLLIEDVAGYSAIITRMIEQSDAPLVHVMVNEANLKSRPISLKAFSDAIGFLRHSRMGWFMIYPSNNQFSKFMSAMVAGITKVRFRRFQSLDETLQFITTMDSTLPPIEELLTIKTVNIES